MRVQILLALYNPQLVYLEKQLASLNAQSYQDLEVLCCDDCSEQEEAIVAMMESTLTRVSWRYLRNSTNLGCNRTFERLVQESSAPYLAFCDQDDIWHENKIEKLYFDLTHSGAVLAYSDAQLINSSNRLIAHSIRRSRRRLKHLAGDGLWRRFLRMNSITGCTVLARADLVKEALPFPEQEVYVWDHWLAIWASHKGAIAYHPHPLVQYRVHDSNLVGLRKFTEIRDRQSYIEQRLNGELASLSFAMARLHLNDVQSMTVAELQKAAWHRRSFVSQPSCRLFWGFFSATWRDPLLFLFELGLALSPGNGVAVIKCVRRSTF